MSKMKLSLFLLALLTSVLLNAQIKNTIFENGDAFYTFPQLKYVDFIPCVDMPPINIDSLIQEDNELDAQGIGRPFRFGYPIETNIGMEEGNWTQIEQFNVNVWSICISSNNAYSLNFLLSDVRLSPSAELYLFNPEGYMVSGPITSSNIYTDMESTLPTTVLVGSSVIIQIIEPISDNMDSRIKISQVTHGYKNTFPFVANRKPKEDTFQEYTLLTCHNDVACYPDWETESKGVVRMINGSIACSGSLLNNAGDNLTTYVLTAFHCFDGPLGDKIWSYSEISDINKSIHEFGYKKKKCGLTSTITYYTYSSGCILRASHWVTDFILIELLNVDSCMFDENICFLGWDRSETVPNSSTCIHHPLAIDMKITFADYVTLSPYVTWQYPYVSPPGSYWCAFSYMSNSGSTQHGSSGAPLFDMNNRVVGQLAMGNNLCPSDTAYQIYGRFDLSWEGGGTPDTRLKDWLDPAGTDTLFIDGTYLGKSEYIKLLISDTSTNYIKSFKYLQYIFLYLYFFMSNLCQNLN